MSARHAELLFGVAGQSFSFDAPEGRPASSPTPTVTVYSVDEDDDGDAELATSGSVTIDLVATTLDVAALAGDESITLDDASDVVRGRRYLVANRERVEVLDVAGSVVTLRRPLVNAHASGASFVGCRLSIALDAAWVADDDNITDSTIGPGYRIRWAYTDANGDPTVAVSYASLVRYRATSLVTGADVDDQFAGWLDRLPPDHRDDQGAAMIRAAHDDVRFDALGDAQVLRRLRDTEVVAELVACRANLNALEMQLMAGGSSPEAVKAARDLYDRRYNQLLREPKVDADPTGDGASAPAQRLPIWVR